MGLPDKIRVEEDEASGQLNPAEKPLDGAIQPATDAAELGKEVVAAFHRLANPADARPALASRGGPQSGYIAITAHHPRGWETTFPARRIPHPFGTARATRRAGGWRNVRLRAIDRTLGRTDGR